MTAPEIIAGTDGSREARRAVRWAAQEARRSDAVLRILTACTRNRRSARLAGGTTERRRAESAEGMLAEARLLAGTVAPGLDIVSSAVLGSPVPALVDAARDAALLVIGSRDRSGVRGLLRGGTDRRIVGRAPGSVAVVRGRRDDGRGPVTVGAGGHGYAAALATGFTMAEERGARLLALRAYADPALAHGEVAAGLEEDLLPWRKMFPGVTVELRVLCRSASAALIDVTRTAAVLVVGEPNRAGYLRPSLDPVVRRSLRYADCPVIVARKRRRAEIWS